MCILRVLLIILFFNFIYPVYASENWYRPSVASTWQWQLDGVVNEGYVVDVYDIDLFDSELDLIKRLQASGKKVICYFSAGSFEGWRPDRDKFSNRVLGKTLDGWEDERWLDIRSNEVHLIMQARLDLAAKKGCDAVEPDNVDGYTNETGFPLKKSDQLVFNRFLATQAHKRGLAIGLKNDLDQVNDLVNDFDFAVNEQCFEYSECEVLSVFIQQNKPVFNAEYDDIYLDDLSVRKSMCQQALAFQFSTLILPLGLDDEFRMSCL